MQLWLLVILVLVSVVSGQEGDAPLASLSASDNAAPGEVVADTCFETARNQDGSLKRKCAAGLQCVVSRASNGDFAPVTRGVNWTEARARVEQLQTRAMAVRLQIRTRLANVSMEVKERLSATQLSANGTLLRNKLCNGAGLWPGLVGHAEYLWCFPADRSEDRLLLRTVCQLETADLKPLSERPAREMCAKFLETVQLYKQAVGQALRDASVNAGAAYERALHLARSLEQAKIVQERIRRRIEFSKTRIETMKAHAAAWRAKQGDRLGSALKTLKTAFVNKLGQCRNQTVETERKTCVKELLAKRREFAAKFVEANKVAAMHRCVRVARKRVAVRKLRNFFQNCVESDGAARDRLVQAQDYVADKLAEFCAGNSTACAGVRKRLLQTFRARVVNFARNATADSCHADVEVRLNECAEDPTTGALQGCAAAASPDAKRAVEESAEDALGVLRTDVLTDMPDSDGVVIEDETEPADVEESVAECDDAVSFLCDSLDGSGTGPGGAGSTTAGNEPDNGAAGSVVSIAMASSLALASLMF